jgi:hypothetical protein
MSKIRAPQAAVPIWGYCAVAQSKERLAVSLAPGAPTLSAALLHLIPKRKYRD